MRVFVCVHGWLQNSRKKSEIYVCMYMYVCLYVYTRSRERYIHVHMFSTRFDNTLLVCLMFAYRTYEGVPLLASGKHAAAAVERMLVLVLAGGTGNSRHPTHPRSRDHSCQYHGHFAITPRTIIRVPMLHPRTRICDEFKYLALP